MTTNKYKENVLDYLNTLFGTVFDTDIIKSVATNFKYDAQKSSNFLLEMTTNKNETNNVKKKNEKIRKSPQRNHHKKMNNNSTTSTLHQSISSNSVAKIASASATTTTNKSKKHQRIDEVIDIICKGYKVLIILRGLPGSGKTYLAKAIIQKLFGNLEHYNQHVFSTDDFFLNNKNVYIYDPNRISEAHEWNQKRTFIAMKSGYSPIIIDNTNTKLWEMKTYATMAIDFGYLIEILEPDTLWLFNLKELIRKNQHNVPKEKIRDMLERYEKNITTQKLLSDYNLSYRNQQCIPQFRSQPPLTYKFNNCNRNIVKSKSYSGIINDNINLMDFNDIKTTKQTVNMTNSNNQIGGFTNALDEILMCKPEDSSTILQPDQLNQTITNENLFNDIENAWGIDEKALQSWDIVTPIDTQQQQQQQHVNHKKQEIINNNNSDIGKFETIRQGKSTMTEFNDFNYLDNYKKQQLPDGYKLINAISRDINGEILKNPHYSYGIPSKVLMLDKSCLTDDDYDQIIIDDRDDDKKLQHLKELFTSIKRSYLKELLDKCNKDFNWVVELVLTDNETKQIKNNEEDEEEEEEEGEEQQQQQQQQIETIDNHDDDDDGVGNNCEINEKNLLQISEESKELKKLIESKIDINTEHYSKHVLRVKQIKFGCLPSTSTTTTIQFNNNDDDDDDDDDNDNDRGGDDSDSDSSFEINPKEMIELNLGDTLVQQLQLKFGNDDLLLLPQGFQPIVQVPINLARQLYMLYMESVCQQMETQNSILESLIKEDEEFAKKLQQQEHDRFLTNNSKQQQESSMNFSEIMEEQAIAGRYQKENEQWKNVAVDTLALKLTKQKLFETFPNIDKNVLLEVLHAYNNDYCKTIEDLCASFGVVDVKEIIEELPLSQHAIQEMKDDEAKCQIFMNEIDENDNHPATFYREKANRHLQNRLELYQKAQNYYQKGMTEVAMFYSELACKETNYYDRANHLAASSLLNEHSKRLEKFDTLDLHFLYVKEAISALDLFIDQNINLLQNNNCKKTVQNLFIITGRGKRSDKGIAKIKPAVISRLKKRKIKYVELNPGLLKIKVGKYSPITSDLS